MSMVILPPIKESTDYFDAIERQIKELFKQKIYIPLIREFYLRGKALKNSKPGLIDAIQSGQITFNRGIFSGRLNSAISKDLQKLGARFDRKTGTYKIGLPSLPIEIKNVISTSAFKFQEKLNKIDRHLAEIVPKTLASELKTEALFDRTLWKVEKEFQKSVHNLTIAPKLTPEQSKRISSEWAKNMQLWIEDFTGKEIKELRANLQKSALSGNRYQSAVKTIKESYGVTANKAKFLARQETALLMAKFKQTRYEEAGVNYYKWGCVAGSPNHPVRPLHRKNEGKVFRWDNPPTVDEQGHRKNPGQDYNCRCFARPIVGYKEQ